MVALAACASVNPVAPGFERICVNGDRLAGCDSRRSFVAWGYNYDHDRHFRLIEDVWSEAWPTVAEDLAELRSLGANTVRIHLQLGAFMRGPSTPDPAALERLSRLFAEARSLGLHVVLTGLGAYRPADAPAWYDALPERDRWQVQAVFWRAVAARGAQSDVVLAYDLMNEPVVPGDPQPRWVTDAALDGLHFVQFLTRDRAGRPPGGIARAWVSQLAAAVRASDPRALVTVGQLPAWSGIEPADLAPALDVMSVHLYPRSGHEEEVRAVLSKSLLGKPVLVEEIAPMACTLLELEAFVREARPQSSGWLGFYWGETPKELEASKHPRDHVLLEWLRAMQRMSSTDALAPQ